jgi:hypothetical protein
MDREGAETYLRLLAEAAMRGSPAPAADPRPPDTSRLMVVGHALTAVGALDPVIAEEILTDFRLAVSVRQLHGDPDQGPSQVVPVAQWLSQGRAVPHKKPHPAPATAPSGSAPSGSAPSGSAPSGSALFRDAAGQERADRFVPVGLTVPFRAGAISGELCLMSFAQTGMGARFVAAWGVRTESLEPQLGYQHPGLIPFDLFTVTDDRGARYQLDHTPGGDTEWPNLISLSPPPPPSIRWLDVASPYRQAVRVDLRPPERYGGAGSPTGGSSPGGDAGQVSVSDIKLSPGEHLLVMLAERLLSWTPEFPHGGRPAGLVAGLVTGPPSGPWRTMAAGFGTIVAALEAADVLSPLSPVPARLAALCASLDLNGHGIAVPPAHDLPEPWLSLLAHYQRRKPEPTQMRDGYAALAASLPELDGIRLTLLGLQHTGGRSALHVLAQGQTPEPRTGPLDIDLSFPLSLWLRDSGGRWHAARQDRCHRAEPESAIRLRLVPPLTRPAVWVEVLAGGRSAEVRVRLPLHWRYPS